MNLKILQDIATNIATQNVQNGKMKACFIFGKDLEKIANKSKLKELKSNSIL